MIVLDLSILNQKGTPMFNSDTFANRPAFGIVGRIFISTDTAAIYRDTGTAWDLIADGGSSSTNIYNSNGTLSANRVVSDGGFGLSFTPTTHIGTAAIGGGGSGKLIVGSSTADNGIQIFGANAPSLRIDNAQSAGTQRFIIGLATSTNNFIQGAIASDFCITTASSGAILFGMWQTINASEVMRISTSNNLIVGSTTDNGNRLQVTGNGYISGNLGLGVITAQYKLDISANSNASISIAQTSDDPFIWFDRSDGGSSRLAWRIKEDASRTLIFETGSSATKYGQTFTEAARFTSNRNLILGSSVDNGNRLQVTGNIIGSSIITGAKFVTNTSFTANCIFNTFTTIYTMTAIYGAMYLVIVTLDGQNTADWAASAIIYTNGTTSSILTQQNATLVSIQTSGLDIQVRQTGTAPDLNLSYRILKMGNV